MRDPETSAMRNWTYEDEQCWLAEWKKIEEEREWQLHDLEAKLNAFQVSFKEYVDAATARSTKDAEKAAKIICKEKQTTEQSHKEVKCLSSSRHRFTHCYSVRLQGLLLQGLMNCMGREAPCKVKMMCCGLGCCFAKTQLTDEASSRLPSIELVGGEGLTNDSSQGTTTHDDIAKIMWKVVSNR